ncbi:hypothetical protein D3C87_1531550 [compost metagenome]
MGGPATRQSSRSPRLGFRHHDKAPLAWQSRGGASTFLAPRQITTVSNLRLHAMSASRRMMMDNAIGNRFGAVVSLVARLPTRLSTRRLLWLGLRSAGRVRGRRQVRVVGVLLEPSLEVRDLGEQLGHHAMQHGGLRLRCGQLALKLFDPLLLDTHAPKKSHRRPPVDGRLAVPPERLQTV